MRPASALEAQWQGSIRSETRGAWAAAGQELGGEAMHPIARFTLILSCVFVAGCTAQHPATLGTTQYARLGPSHSAASQANLRQHSSADELLDDHVELAMDDVGQTRVPRNWSQAPLISTSQVPATSPKRQDPHPTTHASLSQTATDAGVSAPGVLGDKQNHRWAEDEWFALARWRIEDGWYAEREIKAKQAISGICRAC
jgi:hypothetical protein